MRLKLFALGWLAAAACFGGDAADFIPAASLYPPQAGLVQWLVGNDGTNATARVGDDAKVVGVSCGSFDGTTVINCGASPVSDYPFTCASYFKANNVSAVGYFVGVSNATGQHYHYLYMHSDGRIGAVSSENSSQALIRSTLSYDDDSWYYAEARFISSELREIWIGRTPEDLELVGSNTTTKAFNSTIDEMGIGARSATSPNSYAIASLSNAGIIFGERYVSQFPMEENQGEPADIIRGTEGVSTNLTYTTGSGIPSGNLRNGFTPATTGDGTNNTQIDLGVPMGSTWSVKAYWENKTTAQYICGSLDDDGEGGYLRNSISIQATSAIPTCGWKGAAAYSTGGALVERQVYEFACVNGVFTQDGVMIADLSSETGSLPTINGYLMSCNNDLGTDTSLGGGILSFTQSNRNMRPFSTDSMVDTLSGTVYPATGAGSFVTRYNQGIPATLKRRGISLIGQSNAQGLGGGDSLLTDDMIYGGYGGYISTACRFLYTSTSDYYFQTFLQYNKPPPPAWTSGVWGIELPLGTMLQQNGIGNFVWYKSAVGGASINHLKATGDSWYLTEDAYDNYLDEWGEKPAPEIVIYMQGEAEAGTWSYDQYKTAQLEIIEDWKTLYGYPDLKVILTGLPPYYYGLAHGPDIERAKIDIAAADPNVYYIQMHDLPLTYGGGDGHFDADQLINDVSPRIYDVVVNALSDIDEPTHAGTTTEQMVHNGAESSIVLYDGLTNTYAELVAYTNNYGSIHASYDPDTGRVRHLQRYDDPKTNTVLNLFNEVMK